ncbi:unnamed protein product [Heterobilharzia americana]|nr:unnamed protein product [Heterobilharzia americana]
MVDLCVSRVRTRTIPKRNDSQRTKRISGEYLEKDSNEDENILLNKNEIKNKNEAVIICNLLRILRKQ